ncbi:unnamed protein product [Pleuronectes platessa]|uniref:Uncharacterized protein n=1 Tax=Pleuronectes platessa TaxID=8262 RepID=A0A9N7TQU5_PLEPL|nr:unnamed protein product [Pleuronectes platessa]
MKASHRPDTCRADYRDVFPHLSASPPDSSSPGDSSVLTQRDHLSICPQPDLLRGQRLCVGDARGRASAHGLAPKSLQPSTLWIAEGLGIRDTRNVGGAWRRRRIHGGSAHGSVADEEQRSRERSCAGGAAVRSAVSSSTHSEDFSGHPGRTPRGPGRTHPIAAGRGEHPCLRELLGTDQHHWFHPGTIAWRLRSKTHLVSGECDFPCERSRGGPLLCREEDAQHPGNSSQRHPNDNPEPRRQRSGRVVDFVLLMQMLLQMPEEDYFIHPIVHSRPYQGINKIGNTSTQVTSQNIIQHGDRSSLMKNVQVPLLVLSWWVLMRCKELSSWYTADPVNRHFSDIRGTPVFYLVRLHTLPEPSVRSALDSRPGELKGIQRLTSVKDQCTLKDSCTGTSPRLLGVH